MKMAPFEANRVCQVVNGGVWQNTTYDTIPQTRTPAHTDTLPILPHSTPPQARHLEERLWTLFVRPCGARAEHHLVSVCSLSAGKTTHPAVQATVSQVGSADSWAVLIQICHLSVC